jgi:hypothetical protein
MTLKKIPANKLAVEKMTMDKMTLSKMTIDRDTVEKMTLDKMKRCLCPSILQTLFSHERKCIQKIFSFSSRTYKTFFWKFSVSVQLAGVFVANMTNNLV